jgi:thymidylate synthase (FAD)
MITTTIDPHVHETQGSVELLEVMPDPRTAVSLETAVVNAARVSYLGESKGPEKDAKLLLYLLNNHHTSPFEHVVFKFRVKAPVLTWWQWVRHRTWSYNFQSGRYTEFNDEEYYSPQFWRLQSKINKQGSDGVVAKESNDFFSDAYENHVSHSFNLYRMALEAGVSKEQARLFLPAFGLHYTAICTVDAHNLMNFLRLRMASDAQFEIRVYAEKIYEYFQELMPVSAGWMINRMNKMEGL